MPGFTALTVFKTESPQSITAEKLKKYAFTPDKSGEAKVWGWTSLDNLTDTAWKDSSPDKGAFMAFALRIDTRKVAGPVLKLHLQEALRKEEEKARANGNTVPRSRKKELKELITSKLLSKAEFVPACIEVAVDMDAGLVYAGSTSSSALALLQEQMLNNFGLEITPLAQTFNGLSTEDDVANAVSAAMRKIYTDEQSVNYDGAAHTIRMSDQEAVSLASSESGSVNSKKSRETTDAALEEGLQIIKLHLQLEPADEPENAVTFTWNSNFSFSGLKTPTIAASDGEDPDTAFLEKIHLVSQAVGVMAELLAS